MRAYVQFARLVVLACFCGLHTPSSAQPRPQGIISNQIGREVASGVSGSVLTRVVKLQLDVVATKGRIAFAAYQPGNAGYMQFFQDDQLLVWDFDRGVQIDELRLASGSRPIHYDMVSRRLWAIVDGHLAQIEKSADGALVTRRVGREPAQAAAAAADGRAIFAATAGGEILKLDASAAEIWRVKAGEAAIAQLVANADGSRVTILHSGGKAQVLDDKGRSVVELTDIAGLGNYEKANRQAVLLKSGQAALLGENGATDARKLAIEGVPRSVAVSPSGDRLLIISGDGKLSIVDASGSMAVDSDVAQAFFLDDKKYLAVRTDGVTHLRSAGINHYLLAMVPGPAGWVIVDHEGRYDGTVVGTKDVRWRAEKDELSLEQFFESYFQPGLLANYIKEQQGNALDALPAKVGEGVFLPPKVEIEFPDGKLRPGTTAKIVVVAESNGGDLRDEIRVFHNGKRLPQKTRLGSQKVQKDGRLLAVQVFAFNPEAGPNEMFAEAYNAHGIAGRSPIRREVTEGFRSKGKLHVLGVGIDQYQAASMNLGFATNDVKGVAGKIYAGAKRSYEQVLPQFVFDGAATISGIRALLAKLAHIPPEDSLVLVLAGHGDLHKGEWYFLPHDVNMSDIAGSAISVRELQAALVESPVRRIFLMVDACNSGAGIDAFNTYRSFQRKFAEQLGRTAGISVLTATRRDQLAAEVPKLGHGLFTHVVLEGLGGSADTSPKDGRISAHELANYVGRYLEDKARPFLAPLRLSQSPAHFVIGSDFLISDVGL